MFLNVVEIEKVWVRPRCPTKRAGRRGTRRAWKQANPPHFEKRSKGGPKMMRLSQTMARKLMELKT